MQLCSAHLALLPKLELTLDLTEKVLKIHPWWKLFFSKNAGLEFFSCDFIKNELHHKDYTYFGKLSSRYHCYFFYTAGNNSTERTRASQLGLDIYNCVTGNVYIWMPMPMLLPMLRCRCRNFQMVIYQFIRVHLLCQTFKWLLLNLQR